jgi:FTR1 family protein
VIAAALIVLREVFEAALIVGIVLAATRGVARRGLWIAGGIAAGVVGAIVVAGFAERIAAALEGVGQEIFNAGVLLAATAMLGWHNLWMKRHGADLAREMKAVGRDVSSGSASMSVLLLVVGLAVLREGSEVVLFLYGIAAGGADAAQLFVGSALGLAGGAFVGWLLYRGLLRIPPRHLFGVTGWLLLLLAAGMAAQAAGFLVQAGTLPSLVEPLWDSSAWLPEHGVAGQVLHALVGYSERPSGMQLAFFLSVALILGVAMKLFDRPAATPSARAASFGALVFGAALAAAASLAPAPAHAAHVVYSPIVEGGERALEYRGHHDVDSAADRDGVEQHKLELEYAPTARWMTELGGEWEKEPGERLKATEIFFENVFQLTEQGQYWADFGVLAEYAHSLAKGGRDALEVGVLAEKQIGASVATLNLTAEREFERGAKAETEYAFLWRYRMRQAFEPGIELHGEFGEWGEFGRLKEHAHQAGPALLGRIPSAGGRGAFRYEAALLLGLTKASPNSTFRVMLEWEF